MKPDTKQAKALLAQVEPLHVGDKLTFNGFLTGFSEPVVGHCVELEPGHYWQFSLFWNGIHIQNVIVERLPDELVLDVLGV